MHIYIHIFMYIHVYILCCNKEIYIIKKLFHYIYLNHQLLKNQLIKWPNKQETGLLFLHLDNSSLSKILSFPLCMHQVTIKASDFTLQNK